MIDTVQRSAWLSLQKHIDAFETAIIFDFVPVVEWLVTKGFDVNTWRNAVSVSCR